MTVERAIVLAAGQGFQLGGVNKVLIRHPASRRPILEHAVEAFHGKRVTVVVGFRAIEVMQTYPDLDYVINHDWAVSGNALSLGLALDDRPSYVVSGDMFFDRELIRDLDAGAPDLVLTENRENRVLSSIHCSLQEDSSISELYQGPVRRIADPEAIGLFKVTSSAVLAAWRRRCVSHGNLFAGQLIPCDLGPVMAVPLGQHSFDEINTADDYLRLIRRVRG